VGRIIHEPRDTCGFRRVSRVGPCPATGLSRIPDTHKIPRSQAFGWRRILQQVSKWQSKQGL